MENQIGNLRCLGEANGMPRRSQRDASAKPTGCLGEANDRLFRPG
jgi:hypothetical protein